MKKNKPRYKKNRVKKSLKRVNKQRGGPANTPEQIERMLLDRTAQKKRKDPNQTNPSDFEGRTVSEIPDVLTQFPGLANPPAGMVLNPNYIPTQQPSATNQYFIPTGAETPAQRTTLVNTMQGSPQNTVNAASRNTANTTQQGGRIGNAAAKEAEAAAAAAAQGVFINRPEDANAVDEQGRPKYIVTNAMGAITWRLNPAFGTPAASTNTDMDVGDPTGSLNPDNTTEDDTTEDDTTEEVKGPNTDIIRTGVPSKAPTSIDFVQPQETYTPTTGTVTKTQIGDVPSSRIKQLQDISAGLGEGRGDPAQQRYARELLAQYGITASNAVQQLSGDFEGISDPDKMTRSDYKLTADTVTDTSQGALQSSFKPGPAGTFLAETYDAAKADDLATTEAAQGTLSPESIAEETRADFTDANRVDTATRKRMDERQALARDEQFSEDVRSQVQQVNFRDTVDISPTPEAEKLKRKGITDDTISERDAARIPDMVGFEAAKRRQITGEAAKGEAATMLQTLAPIPPDIARTIVEDPASVSASIDNEPVTVKAAVASLPSEALVSSQMESLLSGMEEGEIPSWAKPAVAQVESMMAQRGLTVSTVGRDALFNAIIQTSIPIAQSNAQAIQQRAAQNLSNEQQANMSAATLDMQRRMANLSNEQTAGSQTAQLAQNMATLQSQFNQQAVLTDAQQAQQIRIQDLANKQEVAKLNAINQQAINAQELGNAQQIELAEMQYMNATEAQNMTAEQQTRLAEFQTAADFLSKNAAFKQDMDKANLSVEQQTKMANLSARNAADADSLTVEQQTELANLNVKLQTNLTQAKIAESMGIAQLNVDQQRAITNASTIARIDLTKFSTGQQVELANSQFMQTSTLKDFDARQQSALQNATTLAQMDIQAADLATKTRITNAQSFLQMDVKNLDNRQQAVLIDQQLKQQRILSDQAAANAALQFNASSQNQVNQFMTQQANTMEQFNVTQTNAMKQFNASEINKVNAQDAQNFIGVQRAEAAMEAQIDQFNSQMENNREIWNASNAQAVEQSNIEWRRKSNTIDTAAQNASNQLNAQQTFQMSASEQNMIWQQLRDEAAYLRTAYENDQQRQTSLYATALANETSAGKDARTNVDSLFTLIRGING